MKTPSLLIEIGVEELPLAALDIFYAQARENARKILEKNRLGFKEIFAEATPRRLAFFVEELSPKQKEEPTSVLGPAHDKAYDSEGKPTPALEGFLKSRQASLKDLKIKETPRGRYVALEKVQKGETAVKLIPRILPELLAAFPFPKMMRWEKSGFRFPRPIRWAVVLYGKQTLSFSLPGIKTGRTSYGHRFLAPKALSLPEADWKKYQSLLKSRHVLLSRAERENLISKGLQKKFHQRDFDPDLVHEAAALVEEPFLVQGKFSGTYRDLPEEVLATCMKKYQKVFACRDGQGKLLNRFVAVLNGKRAGLARIQHDYENVLESRLRDAQYFYDEDTKEPLEKKVDRLKEVVFLGRLGTMAERTERLRVLAREFAALTRGLDYQERLERVVERTASLSKADLTTRMVGEFPELQGIIGSEYAEEAGEDREVVEAIREQYRPKNLAEDANNLTGTMSPFGMIFGILDRTDLLVGAFGIRLDPTGSEDPYALRRAGGVMVKLIRAFAVPFSLRKLIEASYSTYKIKLDLSCEEVTIKLIEFLKDRVVFELRVKPGTKPYEILQSILKTPFDDLNDVFKKYEALVRLFEKQPKLFFKTSKVVERTSNILKGVKDSLNSVDPNLFKEPLEKELFELVQKKGPALQESVKVRDYQAVTMLYGETFYNPLHDFFDHVMVNVEDPALRRNRQALMRDINYLYTSGVADLSLLTQVRE